MPTPFEQELADKRREFEQFREDQRRIGTSDADITSLWDLMKRSGKDVTVDIVPNREMGALYSKSAPVDKATIDQLYKPAAKTPEVDALYRENPGMTEEGKFKDWYMGWARQFNLNPDPDDPQHFYDYRAAYKAGAQPNLEGHWPSEFKKAGHPNLIVDGKDTRTGKPVAPSGAAYPEKSGLDKAIGTVGGGLWEYTKGLTGPIWQGAKFFGHDIPDWHINMIQRHLNPDVEMPGMHPLEAAFYGMKKAAEEHPTDLLGMSAEKLREEGPGWLLESPRNVGTLVGDLISNIALVGPAARGAAAAGRRALPATAAAKVDKAIGKVIPKYNFTDAALAEEAAREGRYLAGSAKTQELAKSAQELVERVPEAAPLLEPKIAAGPREMKRFEKAVKEHEMLGPAGGWVPFDYKSRKLELSVDAQGQISYMRAPEFNALAPADQARIAAIRNTIEANSRALVDAGIITDKEMLPGYLAKKYAAFETPRAWARKLETVPGQMAKAEAKDYISRRTGLANDAILNEAVKDVLNPKTSEYVPKRPEIDYRGDWSTGKPNVAIRRQIPEPIEKILGPMEGPQHMPYRVGYTLDAQLKMLTNQQTLDNLARLTSRDGKPLMMTSPRRPPGYVALPDDPIFGKWRRGYMHESIADILPTIEGNTTNNFLSKYISAWKSAKTTMSPSTHLNNVMGDVIFAHLAGINPLNPANTRYYKQAAEELHAYVKDPSRIPSPMVREALEAGGIRPGFAGSELQIIRNRLQYAGHEATAAEAALGAVTDTKIAQKLRDVYDAEDQVFRYAAYLKNRERGLTPAQASAEVNKYFPSYGTTSAAGRYLRGQSHWTGAAVGAPFTSFPLEAARIYATASREQPHRLMAIGALPLTLTAVNLGNSGLSIQEWHAMKSRLPGNMQGRLLIPMVGPNGQIEVADWTNLMPLGNWGQSGDSLADTGMVQDLFFGGPGANAFKIAFNIDPFTGNKMYDPAKGQDWTDLLQMTGKQLLPAPTWALNMMPGSDARWQKAWEEVPPRRYAPDAETVPQAVWRTIFPNLSAKDYDELLKQGQAAHRGEVSEAKKGKRSIQRNPTIPPSEKERRVPNILDEIYKRRQ